MQNTFSLSTKRDKTLPDRSLFLCKQQKHKPLFSTPQTFFPPQPSTRPSEGFVAVYPKSTIFKINKWKFSQLICSSWLFRRQEDASQECRCPSPPRNPSTYISMAQSSHRTQVWSCIFITLSNRISIFFFFSNRVFLIWFPGELRGHGQAPHPPLLDSYGLIGHYMSHQIKGVNTH